MGWLNKTSKPVVVHTDGSCLSNPGGVGGWAAVITQDGESTEIWGNEKVTTNNRMEMLAVIRALQFLPSGSNVYVFTDSQYVQKGITHWVPSWKRKNWLSVRNKPVANKDLWVELDKQNNRHMISWHWVRGHDGDAHNERVDKLAYQAAVCCN